MTCPATPLPPATLEDAPLAPAVGDGDVPLADELVPADPELLDDPAVAEPEAGVSETPVAAPAPEAVPPVEGCIADDPEVVEPEPVAAGRSVAPEGPGLAGAVDWAKAGAAASAVATRQAAMCDFNIDDLRAGASRGAGARHQRDALRDRSLTRGLTPARRRAAPAPLSARVPGRARSAPAA